MLIRKLSLLLLFGALSAVCGNNTYTTYIPKIIRPGSNISITTSILSSNNPVLVTAKLSSKDNATNLEAQASINSGSSQQLNLGQVPVGYTGSQAFSFSIVGVDSVTNEPLFRNSTKDFTFATKSVSILIQTDKAIYQPGQTIKFRAVCLNQNLRPLDTTVKYSVEDPNGNIVMLNTDVVLLHGVAGGELSLNKDAVVGIWKIAFTAKGYKKVMDVEVKLYKLPKFKVEVEAPSYIYPGSPGLTVRLKGTYTYGKPVKGKASLTIVLGYTWGRPIYYSSLFDSSNQQEINHSFENFDGDEGLFVSLDDVKKLLGWDGRSERKITITGSVTEELTGTTFNETTDVDVKSINIKVETLYKPETIKPGLSYTAYIKVTEQDGKVLTEDDRTKNQLIVVTEYIYPRGHQFPEDTTTPAPWYTPRRKTEMLFDIPPDGTVTVKIEAKNDEFKSVSFRAYVNATGEYEGVNWDVKRANSPSNSFLQITTTENNVNPGQNASVSIRSTEQVSNFRIMLISRGSIISDQNYVASNPSSQNHNFQFMVTYSMMPGVQVLASYVRDDGEIVADFIKLTVSTELQNQVSVQSSSTRVDAGTDVTITVQTSSAGAYVGARAIDQSVLLLKSGNDISRERVVNDLNEYSNADDFHSDDIYWRWWWWYPLPSGAKDATEVFKDADILVLTDALLFKTEPEFDEYPTYAYYALPTGVSFLGGFAPQANRVAAAAPAVAPRSRTLARTRSFFPETWLWDEKTTGSDGSATFQTTAPDTITSWVWSVFSVSDQHGLGLTDTFKITVFRQFFVTLNLPLKVTRGEIIIVQAVVFNYLESDVTAQLMLGISSNFELIIPGNDSVAAGASRIINVPSNGAVSVKFPIRANTLGEVPITVSAISELANDALTRVVFVRPEGIPQCYSSSILVNRDSASDPATSHDLQVALPAGIIEGSAKVKLSVYGDILGNTLSNLGRLLKAPYGCGEQNMLNFAPDVFVTLYLHKAGRLDAETRKKAFEHFYNGYMKELNYKHPDGSYSAFGPSDKSGSTWLTAFVAKCFIFARELRPELVEEKIIDQALDFLVDQQNENGSFGEPGRVSHKAMQGGVNSAVTMTAYVVVTLRETNYAFKNKRVLEASNKARTFLENNLDSVLDSKYDLAIVTYALHVAESSRASDALEALNELSTAQGGMRYWEQGIGDQSTYKEQWRRPYYSPPSNDIEMTSYALLTYVRRGNIASAAPIMKWIASKQNELGGYSSTQDTVIAIQAMSNVAGMLVNRTQDLTITATHSADSQFSQQVQVTSANSMVFNQFNLPSVDGYVNIAATGVGVGVAQLSVCYNIPTAPFEGESFTCTTNVVESSQESALLNFCCNLKPDDNATGMFLFEIGLPNGFTVDVSEEKVRNSMAKLVELGDDGINVYYDNLLPGVGRCANVKLVRYAQVGASKPQMVRAMDYYQEGRKVEKLLEIRSLSRVNVCQVCGMECVGCSGPTLSDWTPWTTCVKFCEAELSTREKKCIDPNKNTVLDPALCGLTENPTESRPCMREGFPCPDFQNGLWLEFQNPNHIYLGYRRFDTICQKRSSFYIRNNQDKTTTSLPGVTLNNVANAKQFVKCDSSQLLSPFDSGLGFTVSVLIRPDRESLNMDRRREIYVAYGGVDRPPVYSFEKIWWKDEFRFLMHYDGTTYKIRGITRQQFPVSQWNHVVITWNERNGAKIYINGQSVGKSSRIRFPTPTLPLRPTFYLGKSTYGTTWRRGYAKAQFSALDFWARALTGEEVNSLYSFYQVVIGPNNANPWISLRQLQHFAPKEIQSCFQNGATFLDIIIPPPNSPPPSC